MMEQDFYSPTSRLFIYKALLTPRLIEERMLKLLRQNKIAKWFSGIGQEAISVGTTLSLHHNDYILPMHRNLGVFTSRNVPLYPLFCQLLGKKDGFTQGRERSFHFGVMDYRIVGMISHLAAMMPVANGLAYGHKLLRENAICVSFCGDGATSEGDFHEALNLAAVWNLPVLFIIENNGYGLSTPSKQQFNVQELSSRAEGYGMKGKTIDGNDVITVMKEVTNARKYILKNKAPFLLEMNTFRMRGHEEASGVAYVPSHLFEAWAQKDPIQRLQDQIREQDKLRDEDFFELRYATQQSFESDLQRALASDEPIHHPEITQHRVYGSIDFAKPKPASTISTKMTTKRFIDGIQDGLRLAFQEDEQLIMMGQDIAEYGGVFKVTQGFLKEFGRLRIRNTPIIESGALGVAYGLALQGFKPVVEMQFADFISCGFNQIVNNIAKSRYRWSNDINITIRCPHGAGVGAGPFHSQSPEGWFMQIPGLKVLVPATVQDAQDMTYSALFDPNPTLIFEHKKLYRSLKEEVAEHPEYVDIHKASWIKTGKDAVIITYGYGVQWAKEMVSNLESEMGKEIGILDLRCLLPLDRESIFEAARGCGRVLLLQEAGETMGPMSEISALISEYCFDSLDAPVMRCSSLDTPVPTHPNLEKEYLASSRLEQSLTKLLNY